MKIKRRFKSSLKKTAALMLVVLLLSLNWLELFGEPIGKWLSEPVKQVIEKTAPHKVNAEYAYGPTSSSVAEGTEINSVTYAGVSDGAGANTGGYYRVNSTSSGLDVTVTFNGVTVPSGSNILYVNYNGFVSNASLTYQIQIRDFNGSTWRNLIPHNANYSNVAFPASGYLLPTATTGALSGGQFTVYDGYFSDGSNNPVSTPLSYFVNGSNQVQIRFYSTANAPSQELRIDYLSVEPAIDLQRYAASMNITGGTRTNQYNETTSDDNTTNLQMAGGGAVIDFYLSFTNLPTPYSDANVVLIEASSYMSLATNYDVFIRDFTNGQWDKLNGTTLSNAADAIYYFATSTGQAVTDYVSSGEIRIRLATQATTSNTMNIDFVRVTVGSVTTNTGYYLGEVTRGGTPTGSVSDTQTVDTSGAATSWSIPTSTTDGRSTTEFSGDCGTAANSCAAANIQIPLTLPSNVLVTGVHMAVNYSISSASVDQSFGLRDRRLGNLTLDDGTADATSLNMMIRSLTYPIPPQVGLNLLATNTLFQPQQVVDTVNNAVNVYVRTAATSVATAQTLTWDFAFVSIRYSPVAKSITAAWRPTSGGANWGQTVVSPSNARYLITDDAANWTLTRDVTNGVDATATFSGVLIPTNANKLIITLNYNFTNGATSHDVYIYDFTNTAWRKIQPHETQWSVSTTQLYPQVEIYDGYFSDGSNNPVSTPLSYFVSGNEFRLRIVSANTSNDLVWDYALIEFAKDPSYFAASVTITNGTRTNEYNDTTTDDALTNFNIANSGGINFYFSFNNVITPPAGSNAVYFAISSNMAAGATSYSIKLWNFVTGGGQWEQINGTALTNTSDATYYFIKSIDTWSNYIQSGVMRVQFVSAAAGGSVTVDYIKLILGTVNAAADTVTLDLGDTYLNSQTQIRDLDTSTTFNAFNQTWRVRSYPNNSTARVLDSPSAFAFRFNFTLTPPSNSYPMAIIWQWRGSNSANTAITPQPQFLDFKNSYGTANQDATQFKLTLTSATPPSAVDATTLATSTQTTREGWYVVFLPNVIDTVNNRTTFRVRTSGTTSFTAALFDIDDIFVALRYVE